MALVKWEPREHELSPLEGLRAEVDRLFDDFFRGWLRPFRGAWPLSPEGMGAPSIDLKETETEFVLTASVPGVNEKQLNVNIQEDRVTIEGERREERETKEESYHYKETAYGSFRRVVPLPSEVSAEESEAKLKNGVLTLILPKAAPSKKKIEIKVQ